MAARKGAAGKILQSGSHSLSGIFPFALQALGACVSGVAAFIIEFSDRRIALNLMGRARYDI